MLPGELSITAATVRNHVLHIPAKLKHQRTGLGHQSSALVTCSCAVELLVNQNSSEATRNELGSIAVGYWNCVAGVMPDWARVRSGELTARELRQESIVSHSVVLRAVGAVGSDLMADDPTGWKDRLVALKQVDWSKRNREWENINIVANSVVSNRQARYATKSFLKRKVGLELTEAEDRAITPQQHAEAAMV